VHTFQHRKDKVSDKAVTMYESTLQLISFLCGNRCVFKSYV